MIAWEPKSVAYTLVALRIDNGTVMSQHPCEIRANNPIKALYSHYLQTEKPISSAINPSVIMEMIYEGNNMKIDQTMHYAISFND